MVEVGTHDSLIAKNGYYSCLFNPQPGLINTCDEKFEKPVILQQDNDVLELNQQIVKVIHVYFICSFILNYFI